MARMVSTSIRWTPMDNTATRWWHSPAIRQVVPAACQELGASVAGVLSLARVADTGPGGIGKMRVSPSSNVRRASYIQFELPPTKASINARDAGDRRRCGA